MKSFEIQYDAAAAAAAAAAATRTIIINPFGARDGSRVQTWLRPAVRAARAASGERQANPPCRSVSRC